MTWPGENFGYAMKALAQAIPPERPALIHGQRVVSWGEFDALTDRIAAGLAARGLKPGDIAGQMLRNTPDYLLALWSLWWMGMSTGCWRGCSASAPRSTAPPVPVGHRLRRCRARRRCGVGGLGVPGLSWDATMPDYTATMTVKEVTDIVTFLQAHYKLVLPQPAYPYVMP